MMVTALVHLSMFTQAVYHVGSHHAIGQRSLHGVSFDRDKFCKLVKVACSLYNKEECIMVMISTQ